MNPSDIPARSAALMLHAMPEKGRRQVLDRLLSVERAALEPLLDELATLGIPRSLVTPQEARPQRDDGPTARERVSAMPLESVLEVTRNLSPASIAAMLSLSEWPWRQALLGALPKARRLEVTQLCPFEPALAPRVAALMCERILFDARHRARSSASRFDRLGRQFRRLLKWTR